MKIDLQGLRGMCLTTSRHSGAATDETRRTGRAMAGERLAGNKSEGKLLENNSFRKLLENFSKFIPPETKLHEINQVY